MEHRGSVFRFADVVISEREFSLSKAGEALPIEPKVFKVLQFLLHNPGRAVTKDEILDAVWNDVEVSESSLTRSIAILRRLLGDDIREPRYIATVPTVGYRFVCPVEVDSAGKTEIESVVGVQEPHRHVVISNSKSILWWAAGGVAVLAALAVAFMVWRSWSAVPVIDGVFQLTDDGNPKLASESLASDGSRIYFDETREGKTVIVQMAATGGQPSQIASSIPNPSLAAMAPDASNLLVRASGFEDGSMWLLTLPGGQARKLSDLGTSTTFAPDGRIVFARGKSLFITEKDGSNLRKLVDFPNDLASPAVSPDGSRIRVTVAPNNMSESLWEVNFDGSGAHPLLKGWQSGGDDCCGRWTPDGKYFVFQSWVHGRSDLWALPERNRWFRQSSTPLPLTNGPISYELPLTSADGKHIYAIGLKQRGEIVRYDRISQQFVPYLGGISAKDVTVSRDGEWVTYMSYPDHSLWRSRADGTERMQLTYRPTRVDFPRISPDGTRVAYSSMSATCFLCPYVLSLEGGTPRKITDNASVPTWSPDSRSVVAIVTDHSSWPASFKGLRTVDLQSGKTQDIPNSSMKGGTGWPSNDMLVSFAFDGRGGHFETYDFKTRKWSILVGELSGTNYHWMVSPDAKYLYYMTGSDEPRVMRVRFSDRKVETITSLKNFRSLEDEKSGSWLGVAPDGSPLLTRDIGTQEIYDLSVRWP